MELKQYDRAMVLGLIKQAALAFGVDIRRHRDDIEDALRRNKCQVVLDIGANTGQFATRARKALPEASIYSFEPVAEALALLRERALHDSKLHVVPLALGAVEEVREMLVIDSFTPGSSFLKLSAETSIALSQCSPQRACEVRVTTLDGWARAQELNGPIAIKIDVQGYETQVISGGEETLRRASIVIVEVSYNAVYQAQELFDDTYMLMRQMGFRCVGVTDPTYLPNSSTVIQADALFERRP